MNLPNLSNLFQIFPDFFRKYGLAFIMVASYFGSGSIFIASEAGVRFGYALTWAIVGSALFGFMAQDMSGRLGIFGEPLMAFVRRKLGKPLALAIALWLSLGCVAWTLELTAAVGAGVSELLNGAIGWQPLAVATGLAAMWIGLRGYSRVEHIMTFMMFALMIIYLIVAGAGAPDLGAAAAGVVPDLDAFSTFGTATLVAGILGTTALWPNFFLESRLVAEKGWTSSEDVPTMRRDLGIGYLVGTVVTLAVLSVAASVLRPLGITELESFLTPGLALSDVLGTWAMTLFLIGALGAAFNSIVPIMWTPAYIIPEALGFEVTSTSRWFRIIYIAGVGLGTLSPVVHQLTGLSVVDMIILFPAINGIFGLPIAAALLFWAVNDRSTMGSHRNATRLNVLNASLVLLALFLAVLSVQDFVAAVTA